MRLSELLINVDYISVSGGDPEITVLSCDSRSMCVMGNCADLLTDMQNVGTANRDARFINNFPRGDTDVSVAADKVLDSGALYFCLTGTKTDGHIFASEAVKKGAVALVVERLLPIHVPQVLVRNARACMAKISANFYKNADKEMLLVGITGTNGKTTTSFIIKKIMETAGYKVGLIGTTAIYIGEERFPTSLTTPDPIDLHFIFRQMADKGVQIVVMEVSAHALYLNKMEGVKFDYAVFTNFSQDHLDFFKDMDSYKAAKKLFFKKNLAENAIVNIDDACGREIIAETDIPCFSYGCDNPADVFSINYTAGENGLSYVLNCFDNVCGIEFRLPGRFNMYNTLCAATVCYRIGIGIKNISDGIAAIHYVPGRFNVIRGENFSVIIDYAHTPDGLENVLKCVSEIARGRIITVFGCGGNRDTDKRAKMGEISAAYSDYTVITSDNPRFEEPEKIMDDIERGVSRVTKKYVRIVRRQDAIKYALRVAKLGDIILLAGKGDERYQDIMGEKLPYYDVDEVERAIDAIDRKKIVFTEAK